MNIFNKSKKIIALTLCISLFSAPISAWQWPWNWNFQNVTDVAQKHGATIVAVTASVCAALFCGLWVNNKKRLASKTIDNKEKKRQIKQLRDNLELAQKRATVMNDTENDQITTIGDLNKKNNSLTQEKAKLNKQLQQLQQQAKKHADEIEVRQVVTDLVDKTVDTAKNAQIKQLEEQIKQKEARVFDLEKQAKEDEQNQHKQNAALDVAQNDLLRATNTLRLIAQSKPMAKNESLKERIHNLATTINAFIEAHQNLAGKNLCHVTSEANKLLRQLYDVQEYCRFLGYSTADFEKLAPCYKSVTPVNAYEYILLDSAYAEHLTAEQVHAHIQALITSAQEPNKARKIHELQRISEIFQSETQKQKYDTYIKGNAAFERLKKSFSDAELKSNIQMIDQLLKSLNEFEVKNKLQK